MPQYRESFVFFIDTPEPALLWTGHTDLLLPADGVLPAPAIALGGGELINLPELESLINGIAQRVEVVISGISDETLRFAQADAQDIPGAAVYIGRVEFDEEWQLVGPVEWEWSGEGQKMTIGSDPTNQGRSRTITLHIAAGETTRARSPLSFFTDADQRRNYPTDVFFSHVAGITAGTSRRWGPK